MASELAARREQREVIRLLVDHIIVEDDAIIIHHIVPIANNEQLSLKHNSV
jgi:hypothetical protein